MLCLTLYALGVIGFYSEGLSSGYSKRVQVVGALTWPIGIAWMAWEDKLRSIK